MKKIKLLSALMAAVLLFSSCSSAMDNKLEAPQSQICTEDSIAEYEYEPGDYTESEYFENLPAETNNESYLTIDENLAKSTAESSMLTFSLKVDTAAYTNTARYIRTGNLPPADAVRTEELLNYFSYDSGMEFGDDPFAVSAEVAPSPFDSTKHIAFVRTKTQEIATEDLPDSNLTFLIDTSGSMDSYDKLPLLKEAFAMLVENLGENDRVSIVTYAGSSAVVLDSESGANKEKILQAINNLEAGGSTAGADGILTAYKLSEKNFKKDANNRIILATDGDFNVGVSDTGSLERLVSKKRDNGVYLSILGFGTGNIRDDIMETLSKNGNGNYAYINTREDAEKFLTSEMGANLFTVADDVKAQVEFNPENVKSYRLIGYENRQMSNRDFDDDTKDAGEIGAGCDVVIMFELEFADSGTGKKYNNTENQDNGEFSNELFEVRIRYKNPGEDQSNLMETPVYLADITASPSTDFGFACSVAGFSHLLRDSQFTGNMNMEEIIMLAENNLGDDKAGYRHEYLNILLMAESLLD